MPEQDVKEHLSDYGTWLQRSYGLDLMPSGDTAVLIEPANSPRPSRTRQIILAAAAAAIVLAGAAAALRNDSSGLVVAAASQDPPGPLYVLPEPLSPDTVRNAWVAEDSESGIELVSEIIIVGVPSGADAFTDLATIWVGAPRPALDGDTTSLDLATGPAEVWDDFFTVVVQDRAGTTIRVMADSDRVSYASTILDSLTIDSAGSASIDTDGAFEVIEAARFEAGATYTGTYLDVTSTLTTDGEAITIETATSPSPLLGAGTLGGQLSATRIKDVDGWTITRNDADGEWNGIAWQATPNRIIAVSGHAPLEAIQAVAESLTIASEDEWKTALPNHTTG